MIRRALLVFALCSLIPVRSTEVSESRLLAGVHYRNSVEVGKAMGIKLGTLGVDRYFKPRKGSKAN